MTEIHEAMGQKELLDERIQLSRDYSKNRELAYQAKYNIEMLLVANLSRIRKEKPNVGYDMAILILMEDGFLDDVTAQIAREHYKNFTKHTSKYKGIEKILNAMDSKVSFSQSLMRYQRQGETGQ